MLRKWTQSVCVFSIIVTVVVTTFFSTAISAEEVPQHVRDRHDAAVELARKGDFSAGMMHLDSLIYDYPDFYPAKRDYAIIAAWAEKCDLALRRFSAIRRESPLEGYLVEPISECLRDLRRVDEAMALLKSSLAKNPKDEDAKRAFNDLKAYVERESRPTLSFSRGYSKSKRSGNENANTAQPGSGESQELTYTQEITSNVRAYYRHLWIRGDDKVFATGNVSRASLGARTWFGLKYLLDTEVFTELDAKNQDGVRVNLSYFPDSLWEFNLDHSTAAEDTSLRARANRLKGDPVNPNFVPVKAVRTRVNSSFHTEDYRWELAANYAYYHYSDTNIRRSFGASLAYAYILRDKYEQRVLFNLGSSRNEQPTREIFYYNPETDLARTIGMRTTHVYDTSWERMVDNLTLSAGFYDQKGQNRETIWDITYELELEFSALNALSLSVDYAKRYYDGNGELRRGIYISYSRKL